ncbi:SUMO-targeted ubiquitin ligase complex subunit slx8 [Arthrobotrys musiformis]|uniref:SUMO-targeted ubiquitin ligase complex subunit slx8 n=1 Tax=Arthrobotrys musiformis TaxID=47236 RepID=A0AAV9W630_9PEZI
MEYIDLTASSPAVQARTAATSRTRPRPSRLSAPQPQPQRQLRGRAAASSSSATDSDPDSDHEYDSMEEYLQTNEAYLSSEDSSLDSDATDEEIDDGDEVEVGVDGGDGDEDEDEDEDDDEVPAPAPARQIATPVSRTRSRTTNGATLPAPSRVAAAPQHTPQTRQQPSATSQPPTQPTSSKRPHSETKMRSGSSPAPKKAKTEPVEVVDMINIDDDDDFQKIMHEQMIKTQREEGNARRRIADFKCVICLDDPENLSATTCGHLFCNDCIKTTLRFGQPAAKFGKCPVCRGKVVIKEIVPLELKLIKRVEGKGKGKA